MRGVGFVLFSLLAFLASPMVALADGGDVHVGNVALGMSPRVAIIAGGAIGLLFLFLLVQWVYRIISPQRKGARPGTQTSRSGPRDGEQNRTGSDADL